MIQLKIIAPLPELLGFSQRPNTMQFTLEFFEGVTINKLFEILANDYPRFEQKLRNDENIFSNLLLVVNEKLLNIHNGGGYLLPDECKVSVMLPYQGG